MTITPTLFHSGKVQLYGGDCMDVLDQLEPDSIDAVVSDPPYHLTSIVERFGGKASAPPVSNGKTGVYKRAASGFMGQQWDGGDIAFRVELWRKIYRVLKPGGWVIAFSAARTYHRMAVGAEDAGFEIRNLIPWLYGCGFPKSHDISKAIDKRLGFEREVIGVVNRAGKEAGVYGEMSGHCPVTAPSSPEAKQWDGWGTALKDALEPAMLARKPTPLTYAENVLAHGVGGLNIKGCVVGDEILPAPKASEAQMGTFENAGALTPERQGRWPANVLWDGSESIERLFAERDVDEALNFFYSAKADAADRLGSNHPTVKPLDLMRYLVRLVTPPDGLVLDMFAGTGTTGEAALLEGMRSILIEREAEYQADIANRMAFVNVNRTLRRAHHNSKRPQKPTKAEREGQMSAFEALDQSFEESA